MGKFLSLSLGLLSAATSFAAEKSVTIPAVPTGNCSFVINEIPKSLGLEENEVTPLQTELVGKEFSKDTTLIFKISDDETINCTVSTGKRNLLTISDNEVCRNENILTLANVEQGSYWVKNESTGEYQEVPSKYTLDARMDIRITKDTFFTNPVDTTGAIRVINDSLKIDTTNIILFGKNDYWAPMIFILNDTVTGCEIQERETITIKNCDPIPWMNYSGPKEIDKYYGDDYLYYLNMDSIMVLKPQVNCICPLPLDTIVESTQSEDTSSCGFFRFDVTVKLAVKYPSYMSSPNNVVYQPIFDTIVAYVFHVDNLPSAFLTNGDTVVAASLGNCTFTVPSQTIILYDPLSYADCDCVTSGKINYLYSNFTKISQNLYPGDTLTESTDLIYTYSDVCNGEIVSKTHIIVPKSEDIIKIHAVDTTVYKNDNTKLDDVVSISGEYPVQYYRKDNFDYISFSGIFYAPTTDFTWTSYRDSISEENKIYTVVYPANDEPISYILDNKDKTGTYYHVAKDTHTGCKATVKQNITVLEKDNANVSLHIADINDEKGDVYTISGVIVKRDVYLKDVVNSLENGIYIFNNKKVCIRRN